MTYSPFRYKGIHLKEFLKYATERAGDLPIAEVPFVDLAVDWSVKEGIDLKVTQTEDTSGRNTIWIVEQGPYLANQPIGIRYIGRDDIYSAFNDYAEKSIAEGKLPEDAPITKTLLVYFAKMWKKETGTDLEVIEAASEDGTALIEIIDRKFIEDIIEDMEREDKKLEFLIALSEGRPSKDPDWYSPN